MPPIRNGHLSNDSDDDEFQPKFNYDAVDCDSKYLSLANIMSPESKNKIYKRSFHAIRNSTNDFVNT